MRLKTGFLIALAGIAFSVFSFFVLDIKVAKQVLVQDETAVAVWGLVTEMGNSTWMALSVIAIGMVAFAMRRLRPNSTFWPLLHRRSIFVFTAVAVPGILVLVVKGVVGRARPYMVDGANMIFQPFAFDSDFASWPSGHTTTTFAFAMAVGMLFPRLRYLLFPLAALTGFSRMTLGVHYIGDVVMATIVGILGAYLVYTYFSARWKI